MYTNISANRKQGFTLVELLIVVALITILSGLTLQIINVRGQRAIAEDEVRRSNLNSIKEGIEAFRVTEGRYPTTSQDSALSVFIELWPDGKPSASDQYVYGRDLDGQNFGLVIARDQDNLGYKYRSDWGEIRVCSNLVPVSNVCGN